MSDNKETAIIKYNETEIEKSSDSKLSSAINFIKNTISKSKSYDLLKYRFHENGLVLFIYGPSNNQDEDKVIERLEDVIRKYKAKRGNRKPQAVKVDSFLRKLLNG
jgi:hypothetical protein